MENMVFFGKGGIGKSTISSNVSVVLAAKGRKVLHIGCDPKMDSVISLMGRHISPFTSDGIFGGETALLKNVHLSPIKGVSCMEAGGPLPGMGCAGTGIGAMLDAMKDAALLEKGGYDAAVFDVLGDVVCAGFAAPLRSGFARKAVIVVSEEILSLFAANKLISMLNNYSRNGVFLAGLVVNTKDRKTLEQAQVFAKAANTRILGVLFRSEAVGRAEKARKPVVLLDPKSEASRQLVRLCAAIESARPPESAPVSLNERDFPALFGERAPEGAGAVRRQAAKGGKAASPDEARRLMSAAGLSFLGIASSQLLFAFRAEGRELKVILMHSDNSREGMLFHNDWALCAAPGESREACALWDALAAQAGALSGLRFDDILLAQCGDTDFPCSMDGFDALLSSSRGTITPKYPHMAFGQWHRFLFPAVESIAIPQGAVMLEHGDCECRFNSCHGTSLGIFRPPAGLKAAWEGPVRMPKDEPSAIHTDFNSLDALHGDETKLNKAMDLAASRTGRGGLVELYQCCTPMIVASDLRSVTDRAFREKGVHMIVEDYNDYYQQTPGKLRARAAFIARKLKAAGIRKPAADVNLVGFVRHREELSRLLSRRGLSVVPPGTDPYRDMTGSRLQVLAAPDAELVEAFGSSRLKWISPETPYGFVRTRAWIANIFSALGRKPEGGPGPESALLAEMKKLCTPAAGFRAGFVLPQGEMSLLEGSSATAMVPVIPFLCEAGFGIRLMVYAPGKEERKKAALEISAFRSRISSGNIGFSLFDTPETLQKLLSADSRMRLVYSDVTRDSRIISAGRNVLLASAFEPGYYGAVETARRLLELCRCDFNEKYLLGR